MNSLSFSPKVRFGGIMSLLLITGGLGAYLLNDHATKKMAAADQKLMSYTVELFKIRDRWQAIEDHLTRIETAERKLALVDRGAVEGVEFDGLVGELAKAANVSGASVRSLYPKSTRDSSPESDLEVRTEVLGGYTELANFFEHLLNEKRIIFIDDLELEALNLDRDLMYGTESNTSEGRILHARASLRAYRSRI